MTEASNGSPIHPILRVVTLAWCFVNSSVVATRFQRSLAFQVSALLLYVLTIRLVQAPAAENYFPVLLDLSLGKLDCSFSACNQYSSARSLFFCHSLFWTQSQPAQPL
jgi:hypothetical protein